MLYRSAIGPVNPDFYLPLFARFEAADRAGLSWNTAAGLLTFNWLVYRQLWGAALGYAGIVVALALLVFGIGRLVFQWSDNLTMALSLGLGLAAFVVPGLLGNALFQKECRKRMAKVLTAHTVVGEACLDLQRQSSSRLRILWVAMANVAVLGIVAFAYVQLSTFSPLAAMPQGALEAGHTAKGLVTASSSPIAAASVPEAPVSAPEPATVAASAPGASASAPVAAASMAPASTVPEAAPAPTTPPSTPLSQASAALAVPVAAAPAASSAPAAEPSASAQPAVPIAKKVEKAAQHPQPKVTPKPTTPTSAKLPPAAKTASTAPQALFYINVGLFSKPQNAARVHAQLLEANLPSVMKELKTTKERQIRVRVGPFATEAQAEVAADKIKVMKFDAGVIQQ